MRPDNGYCPRTGAWVNALAEAPKTCYVGKDELDDDIPQWHPPVRETKKSSAQVWRSGRGVPDGKKYCPTCDRILPRENFCECKTRYDGVNWECRECVANRRRRVAGKDKPSKKQ